MCSKSLAGSRKFCWMMACVRLSCAAGANRRPASVGSALHEKCWRFTISPVPAWISPALMVVFDPLFRNPHLQTIAGHLWRRQGEEKRFPLQRRLYRTEPNVQVLVQSQHPAAPPAGHIITVHGLEGSG